ncbi:MAG: NAD-dependent DNA ligase LigA [Deltaproteobacteria bacterium]|jgi:DNA ligase (NAD+)|nr:NAD-dependent DNA ligase LigA [Deltaproteobacteria bacterium]
MPEVPENIKKRADFLRKEIERHNILYFQKDTPEIEDSDYDQLLRELEDLEAQYPQLVAPDSPTHRVGAKGTRLPEVIHTSPMLSLDKALKPEELLDFEERVRRFLSTPEKIPYFTMPKFDGLAVELEYSKGLLTLGSTRGDGQVGEDVTQNVFTIKDIPKKIKGTIPKSLNDTFKVRGEVYMEKARFARLNSEREEKGLALFANPRNAAAGSLRQLDAAVTKERPLRFFAYGLADPDPKAFPLYSGLMEKIGTWGFSVEHSNFTRKASSIEEVMAIFHEIQEKRESLPFEADGLVVTIDKLELWPRLGVTARAPRWAVAAKFKPLIGTTKVKEIEVQVGRTGALTPVAVMDPVRLGGVTVSQATLHNYDELSRKDVRPGDWVKVHRAGDVIPEILEVILEKRPPNLPKYEFPKDCPICGTPAIRPQGEAVFRCPNKSCPAQIEERLIHFASKNCLDMDGLGPKLINLLIKENLVTLPTDLFRLKGQDLESLPRLGKKSAENILSSIEKAKTSDLWRFIHALSIRHVGERVSQILADQFKSLKALSEASLESLMSLGDIGPEVAKSVVDFFQSPLNGPFIEDLLGEELGLDPQKPIEQKAGSLWGKKFVLTGTLPTLTRAEAKARIAAKGGRVLSSVSKETDFVVAGEATGQKLSKAMELKIPVLDEENFLKLLEKGDL